MKKILYTIALLLTWVSVALATDVTITQVDLATNSVSAKIPNFNVNNLGNNAITISNVTIVNGTYATLSCSACFRPTWVGLGGFTIKVGTDLYTVRNVDSTSQVTLTKGCTQSSPATVLWYPYVEFRIYADRAFQPLGANYVVQPGTPGSGSWYKRYAASILDVNSVKTLYLPEMTIDATTDSPGPTNQARYMAAFYRPDNSLIQFYACFEQFVVPPTTPTTWTALCAYNSPPAIVPPANEAYTKTQIDARFPSCTSGQMIYYAATGNAQSCLTVGSGLTLSSGTLSTTGTAGTVTSVGLSLPGIFTVSGSPVTTSGTLTGAFTTQNANRIFAGPSSGAAATPAFRALVPADLPNVRQALNAKIDYGCAGDGITDDTACIAAMLAAAQTSSNKLVYFPTGTYLTDAITASLGGLVITGDGPTKSIIKAIANDINVINVTGAGYAANLVIRDLGIHGRGKASGNTGHCIYINDAVAYLSQFEFNNLEIKNCRGNGIYVPYIFNGVIRRVTTDEIGGNHFDLGPANTVTLEGNYVQTIEARKVGYRLRGGTYTLISNNGMDSDSGTTAFWGMFGSKAVTTTGDVSTGSAIVTAVGAPGSLKVGDEITITGAGPGGTNLTTYVTFVNAGAFVINIADTASANITGATITATDGVDSYFNGAMLGNNIESFGYYGLRLKENSKMGTLSGNSFQTDLNAIAHIALKIDYAGGSVPAGIWDQTNSLTLNAGTWANSSAIHSQGAPFFVVGGNPAQYYETSFPALVDLPTTIASWDGGFNEMFNRTPNLQGDYIKVGVGGTTTGQILFQNAGNSNRLILQAGATGSNLTFTLPTADGSASQCLITNGSGVLSFGACGGSSLPVADTQTIVKGSVDATKLIRFEVDGLTTATTRVLTPPDADIIIAGSASALTSGRVPYVTTGGLLTDSARLLWDNSTYKLSLSNNSTLGLILQAGGGTTAAHPASAYGLIMPYVGGGQATAGPGIFWTDGTYTSMVGLWLNLGLNFQGTGGVNNFKIRKSTDAASDGNIVFDLRPNDGRFDLYPYGTSATNTTQIAFRELAANGTNYVAFRGADSIAADITWILPSTDSTGSQCLASNGSGTLSWTACSGGGTPGGSNKQVQFNNSSAFGGAAGFEYQSGASPNVSITAQNAAYVPLYVNGASSQTANLQQWAVNSTVYNVITKDGYLYLGRGETSATPSAGRIYATGGSGTNIAGASLLLYGGAGTGTGAGGSIAFYTAAAGGSGSTPNTPVIQYELDQKGNHFFGNAQLIQAATDGFVHIPGIANVPSGVPTLVTGLVPLAVDETNYRLYGYSGGAWRNLTGGAGGITVGTTTITSGTNTRVLYNNSGVVGEYTVTGSGNVVMSTNPTLTDFTLSGNISAAAWTTSGVRIKGVASTLTDTSSSGTVAVAVTNALGGNTIAASNSTTYTDYFTTRMAPATAGTNVTITRNWALGLTGGMQVAPAARTGSPARGFQLITPADTALTASTENIFAQFGGDATAATVTRQFGTGALTTQREYVFVAPTYSFVGASTLTTAATVAITGEPAAGANATITNPIALYVGGRTGINTTAPAAQTHIVSAAASRVGLRVDSAATPSADVFQVSADNGTTTHFKVTSTGAPSSPGAGSNSERYGSGATAAGANSTAFGTNASAAGANSTVFGSGSVGAWSRNIAIGKGVSLGAAGVADQIFIGNDHSGGNLGSFIIIGFDFTRFAGNYGSSILIGHGIGVNEGNAAIIGGVNSRTDNVYFGKGVANATPTAYTINGTGGSGTNIAGANLNLAGGKGTGTGIPGTIGMQFAREGTTGTSLNALSDEWRASYSTTDTVTLAANIKTSTTTLTAATAINALWTDATHATRTAALTFSTVQNAAAIAERARVTFDGTRSHFILGNGATAASPTGGLVQATSGSGTDIAGADLVLAGGRPTGSGAAGQLVRKYSLVGATGTTLRSLSSNNYNIPAVMFTATADATVANTVTETTLIGSGVGTATVEAGMWRVGRTIRIRVTGYLADTGTPTLRIRWKLGSTIIADTTATSLSASVSGNEYFEAFIDITCRSIGASGTVIGQGMFRYHTGSGGVSLVAWEALNTAAITIDTTAAQAIDVMATWGTANASNTITATNATIEILN